MRTSSNSLDSTRWTSLLFRNTSSSLWHHPDRYAFTARTCVSGLRSLERRYDGHAAASIADLGDVDAGGAGGRAHTFMGAVTFGKAGAETLQVTQADDPKVRGRTTFAIA